MVAVSIRIYENNTEIPLNFTLLSWEINDIRFKCFQAFAATDKLLLDLDQNAWPVIKKIDTKGLYNVFKSKLSFQIRHSVFREKVKIMESSKL